MIKMALGVVISDNAADGELSGNAADDGKGTCLAAIPLMMHALAGVPAFALCDREITNAPPFERTLMICYTRGDLSWE